MIQDHAKKEVTAPGGKGPAQMGKTIGAKQRLPGIPGEPGELIGSGPHGATTGDTREAADFIDEPVGIGKYMPVRAVDLDGVRWPGDGLSTPPADDERRVLRAGYLLLDGDRHIPRLLEADGLEAVSLVSVHGIFDIGLRPSGWQVKDYHQ